MATAKQGYLACLWAAFLGRDTGQAEQPPISGAAAELRARVAALEMDLRERDQRIEQMRGEHATLAAEKQRVACDGGQEQMERVYRKLSAPLANLMALVALVDAKQQVEARDMAQLIKSVEKELARAGMEPIGKPGEEAQFDASCHQRMSGGVVHGGARVTVRLPGYRMGQRVLLKAMVTAPEA